MGYLTWKKGENFQASPHFSTKSLECRCTNSDCIDQKISLDLLERLESVRAAIDLPIYVTSAYRCSTYQSLLRGTGILTAKGISQHELGNAVDVYVKGNMNKFLIYLEEEFNAIGTANTFYHVDTRDDKVRRWEY